MAYSIKAFWESNFGKQCGDEDREIVERFLVLESKSLLYGRSEEWELLVPGASPLS